MASLLSRSRISKVNCTPILQVFGIGRSFLANVMVRDFFSCLRLMILFSLFSVQICTLLLE